MRVPSSFSINPKLSLKIKSILEFSTRCLEACVCQQKGKSFAVPKPTSHTGRLGGLLSRGQVGPVLPTCPPAPGWRGLGILPACPQGIPPQNGRRLQARAPESQTRPSLRPHPRLTEGVTRTRRPGGGVRQGQRHNPPSSLENKPGPQEQSGPPSAAEQRRSNKAPRFRSRERITALLSVFTHPVTKRKPNRKHPRATMNLQMKLHQKRQVREEGVAQGRATCGPKRKRVFTSRMADT